MEGTFFGCENASPPPVRIKESWYVVRALVGDDVDQLARHNHHFAHSEAVNVALH